MGMEISSQRLQQADSRMQAEKGGTPREPDSASKEKFEKAMERDSERGARGESSAPSPSSLMESLFGGRMGGMTSGQAQSASSAAAASGDMGELVDRLVERILVSDPGRGSPEVRISLGEGVLSGAELSLSRAADGQLFVRLSCADAASFQTAVGAQDALRAALERGEGNVRVEVAQGGAEGGNEGDTRRRSATYEGWGENG
ncbi:MAG TPA: hypothetical protein H9991_01950 [Candidatus Mailhella excrementigallinarum]|mgnify:FL=1|nr:MAG: hypothetical protein DBY37_15255 [Desulfovibrionaceae bacterium]HIV64999.1 hypothetical protein [Candidatus Mailhella excrementigallinarum]